MTEAQARQLAAQRGLSYDQLLNDFFSDQNSENPEENSNSEDGEENEELGSFSHDLLKMEFIKNVGWHVKVRVEDTNGNTAILENKSCTDNVFSGGEWTINME